MKVSASFLSSKKIVEDIIKLNQTDVDYIHLDILDGKFAPNKSLPFSELKHIYKYTSKRLDVHLMVTNPSKYIPLYASLNTEFIIFHLEVDEDIEKNLKLIKKYSIKAGLAIKPDTKVNELLPYLPFLDIILIMSVEPGFGGQEFIEETGEKLKELKKLLNTYHNETIISVDGGINDKTRLLCNDASIVVSGSYIINSDNFQDRITSLR